MLPSIFLEALNRPKTSLFTRNTCISQMREDFGSREISVAKQATGVSAYERMRDAVMLPDWVPILFMDC